jgi:hypothetical protein
VGQFGRRQDGRLDRFVRSGTLWNGKRFTAVGRRDGVHRAFGSRGPSSLPRLSLWARKTGLLLLP